MSACSDGPISWSALRQTLSPQDEIKIVLDRRRSRSSTEAPPRPGIERRRHPHLDLALIVDGFAIVPESASGSAPAQSPGPAIPIETPVVTSEEKRDAPVDPLPLRVPSRRVPNPAVQRLFADEPRDQSLDDAGLVPESASGSAPAQSPGPAIPIETPVVTSEEKRDAPVDSFPLRVPIRRVPNPAMQRLFADEPRDESLDDAGLGGLGAGADVAERRRLSERRPRMADLHMANPHMARPRIPRPRDARFGDDHDESRHVGSRTIWLVTGVVAVISVLAILFIGQAIEPFKLRTDPRRLSTLNRPLEAAAPDASTDKPAPPIPSSGVEPARGPEPAASAAAEPARVRSTAPAPPPPEVSRIATPRAELPTRRTPQPAPEAGAQPRRQAEPPAPAQPATRPDRPIAESPTFPGLPRVALIRSPAPASSGTGGTYVVRISDTEGRPLVGAEASLVDHIGEGGGNVIPLDPGPEPGTYRAVLPPGRSLRDLRVRIMTSNTRFDVPVEP